MTKENLHAVCSEDQLDSEKSFTFSRKHLFTANKSVITARGQTLIVPKTTASKWEIKPPDFTPKLFCALHLPRIKMKTLDATELIYGGARKSQSFNKMPQILLQEEKQKIIKTTFIKLYKPPDLLELQLQFVKSGQFPRDLYQNPKPYNFRPCAENLADLVTSIEKDPQKFKSQFLESRIQLDPNPSQEDTATKMITLKPTEPKWDAGLILPKSPWPTKSASYTRHRRRRGVSSALLDRVEEKFNRSWMTSCVMENV
ncbi:uncharacterized protein si:dkey-30e9.6 [Trichomycterus rosablanca]|uniref:uncharacterized protein si:dkey-30e9.6 n=1 Tax=Trichomycterus rosablanca TaxID=2290929 RepID=UPI002F3597CF